MDHRLIEGLMEVIAPLIKSYVDERIAKEVTPLHAKLAEYQAATPEKGEPGFPGKDVDPAEVAALVAAEVAKAFEGIEKPVDGRDGQSVTVDDVRPLIEEMVAAIEPAKDGKDADPAEVAALIIHDVAKMIPPPADGKSVSIEEVLPFLEEIVEKRVSAIPVAVNGKDGEPGKDGVGLAGAVLGRAGELVMTFSDGTTKDLGVIIGKDGDHGKPGEDGKDGFGFEDLDATYDGERTVGLKFSRGDQVKEFSFKMPIVIDRDVYKEGREQPYEKGDGVTFGGSFWIAQKDAPEGKPQDGSRDWRLAVKRGRNGADGVVKTLPPQGPVKA